VESFAVIVLLRYAGAVQAATRTLAWPDCFDTYAHRTTGPTFSRRRTLSSNKRR